MGDAAPATAASAASAADVDGIGVFETGFSILFNVPEINLGEPGWVVPVRVPGLARTVSLQVPDIDARNTSLFAHHVWKASILLARLLAAAQPAADVAGRTVVELGAGTGLPSIAAGMLGARAVVASDFPDAAILDALRRNLDVNLRPAGTRGGDGGDQGGQGGQGGDDDDIAARCHVVGHVWGDDPAPLLHHAGPGGFDVVLLADTFWMAHQHDNLLADVTALLAPQGVVLAVAGLHTGRRTMEAFFDKAAREHALVVERLAIVEVPVGSGSGDELVWNTVPDDAEIPDTIEERMRYLFAYRITR
ncbi:hypothetical protein HK105_200942 [Polyrhizophydium stewartii]|uniref:Uncharacterized protein n=1 Tax=Polyrhizophydium stewartii TaxID=2732419 RepID=A0ABR4NIE2_9FUNG|nr:hypothetical protein HK105_001417 [Polyrhizophydium stewartii]